MKVIEVSVNKKRWSAVTTCVGVPGVHEGCGATLEIEEDDLFRVEMGNTGFQYYIAQFICPKCNCRTDFDNYPEPCILRDFWAHEMYNESADLKGYSMPRKPHLVRGVHRLSDRQTGKVTGRISPGCVPSSRNNRASLLQHYKS